MKTFAREIFLLAIAGAASWWLFLYDEEKLTIPLPLLFPGSTAPIVVAPDVEELVEKPVEQPPSEPALPENGSPGPAAKPDEERAEVEEKAAEAPPPPERGSPHGNESAENPEQPELEPEPEEAEPEPSREVQALMEDGELRAAAEEALHDDARKGFETQFLAAAEDQLAIARFFGEEIVLAPYSSVDPSNEAPHYFRISPDGAPAVEKVGKRLPQHRYRQYRDLFQYDYTRLPAPVRELRRALPARSDIYLFASLIPVREWAVVIARRRTAVAQAGRELDDVRRFTLRYERLPDGGYDIQVTEILFADGRRWSPDGGLR